MMTRREQLEFDRLRRQLDAERERAERAWAGYRDALGRQVDAEARLEAIREILSAEFGEIFATK